MDHQTFHKIVKHANSKITVIDLVEPKMHPRINLWYNFHTGLDLIHSHIYRNKHYDHTKSLEESHVYLDPIMIYDSMCNLLMLYKYTCKDVYELDLNEFTVKDYFINESIQLLIVKAKEYATEDRLHNFYKVTEYFNEINPLEACFGYMCKHVISIGDVVNRNINIPKKQFDEKCLDTYNYHLLMLGLVEDFDHSVLSD